MSEIYLGTPPPGVVSWCEKKYGPQYMTIEALDDGVNVNIRRTGTAQTGTFQVQLNDEAWKDILWEDIGSGKDYNLISAIASDKSSMSKGDKLRFRNIDAQNNNYSKSYTQLKIMHTSNGKALVYGKLIDTFAKNIQFNYYCLFDNSNALINASKLDLADIIVTPGCYTNMFSNCTSLTSAPALPATTLADNCYWGMFSGCTSLVNAPKLPATTLADQCYNGMFSGCTSLVNAPKLPATTLVGECYVFMFNECTKIIELHYPASIKNDDTFKKISGSPKFGATNATAYFDL